jgi:hypothetical protein
MSAKDLPSIKYRRPCTTWSLTKHKPPEHSKEQWLRQEEFYRTLEGASLITIGRECTTSWKRDTVKWPNIDDDFDHWQVGLTWAKSGRRFSHMIKLFKRTHVELASDANGLHNYCGKEINSIRIDNRVGKGHRSDLDAGMESAKRRVSPALVWKTNPNFMLRHYKAYNVWLGQTAPKRDKWTYGVWLWGPPELGKSNAWKQCFPYSATNPQLTNGFFCGDMDAEVVCFDDQDIEQFKYQQINQLINHTEYLANCKGGHTSVSARVICFISNYPPPADWPESTLSRFKGKRGWTIKWDTPVTKDGYATFPMDWPLVLKGQGPGAGGRFKLPTESMDDLAAELQKGYDRRHGEFLRAQLVDQEPLVVPDEPMELDLDSFDIMDFSDDEPADQDPFLQPPPGMPPHSQPNDSDWEDCPDCGNAYLKDDFICEECLRDSRRVSPRKRNRFVDDESEVSK